MKKLEFSSSDGVIYEGLKMLTRGNIHQLSDSTPELIELKRDPNQITFLL